MMLVAVCSLKGSPGVSTFSVALAARWPVPARRVLVECDPSGGDVATRFGLASSPGLVSLAAAARRSSDPELLWRHTQALPGGLPVVAAPPGADHALAALSALAPEESGEAGVLRLAAKAPNAVVIADCGRVDPSSVVLPIVCSADVMLLLSRAHADDLAHLATRLSTVGRWSPRPGLLLVGEGYSAAEVSRELGVPVMGRIPEDRPAAAALCGRPSARSTTARSELGQSAVTIARTVLSGQPAPPGPAPSRTPAGQPMPAPRAAGAGGGQSGSVHGIPVEALMPIVPAPGFTSRNGTSP
jgi:hypothetical protein